MKKCVRHMVFGLTVSGLALSISAQKVVTEIADFGGMAGCWEQKDAAKKLLISEQWMPPPARRSSELDAQ